MATTAKKVSIRIIVESENGANEVKKLKNAFDSLGDEAKKSGSSLKNALDGVDTKNASRQVRELQQQVQEMRSGIGSALSSFAGNVAADALSLVTSRLYEGGKAVFDYSARLEQTKIGFTTLMGGAAAANKHLDDLRNFANSTPFEFEFLTDASRRLQNVGVEGERIVPIMTAVGNAVAAAGGNSETLDGVTLALSQIIAKGKVSAEELNQLSERGVSGLRILESQTGKSKAEVLKLAEQGKISSDVFIQAFENFSRQNYGESMAKQSKTFNGALSTIKDALLTTSTTAFEPYYKEASGFAVKLSEKLTKSKDLSSVGVEIGKALGEGAGEGATYLVDAYLTGIQSRFVNGFNGEFFDPITSAFIGGFAGSLQKGAITKFAPLAIFKTIKDDFGTFSKILSTGKVTPEELEKLNYFGLLNGKIKEIKETLAADAAFSGRNLLGTNAADIVPVLGTIKAVNENLKQTGATVAGTPSLKDKLEADKAAEDAAKLNVSIASTIKDLSLQIQFYGDASQVAATKQQLIRQGVSDFNSEAAKSALFLAQTLDALKENEEATKRIKEQQDEYANKLKSTGEQLKQVREQAGFDLKFANPTEIDRFNAGIGKTAAQFPALRKEIEATRDALNKLAFSREIKERDKTIFEFTDNVREKITELNGLDVSRFNQTVKDLVNGIELTDAVGRKTSASDFAADLESRIVRLRDGLTEIQNSAIGLQGSSEEITKALNQRTQTAVARWYEDTQTYLGNFKKTIIGADGKPFLANVFSDSDDFQNVKNFVELFNADSNAVNGESLDSYNDLLAELTDKTAQAANASEFNRTKKLLETEAYRGLDAAQRQVLLNAAKEVDFGGLRENLAQELEALQRNGRELTAYEDTLRQLETTYKDLDPAQQEYLLGVSAQIDAQRELNKQFEETRAFFRESLDYIAKGDFKGLLGSIKDQIQDSLFDNLSEFLAGQVLGIDLNKGKNPVADAVKEGNNYLAQIARNTSGTGGNQSLDVQIPQLSEIKSVFGSFGGSVGKLVGGLSGFISKLFNINLGGASIPTFNGSTIQLGGNSAGGGLFGGNSIGSLFGGSGAVGTRTGDMVNGAMQVFAGDKGRENLWSNAKNIFSGKDGSFFGKGGIFGADGFGSNIGTFGAIGSVGSMVGGLIGGRAGGMLSGAMSGMAMGAQLGSIIPGVGTAIGAAVGAAGGFLMSLLGGDPKRKADAKTNMPQLTQALGGSIADMQKLIDGVRAVKVENSLNENVRDITTQATQIRQAIAAGGGVQMQSKKYQKEAASKIQYNLQHFDKMQIELRDALSGLAVKQAEAKNRQLTARDFTGEFAGGVFMDAEFRAQHNDFKRYNGMMPGAFTGRDHIKALIADGEIVANPTQIERMRRAAGFDVIAHAGLPNYKPQPAPPRAKESSPKFASGVSFAAPMTSNSESQKQPEIRIGDIVINLNGKRITDAEIESIAINGVKRYVGNGGRTSKKNG